MERIKLILDNSAFKSNINKLKELEKDRIFCRHGIEHLLDVARIAALINEKNAEYNKSFDIELIYAVALLHDIGRVSEYEKGISHEEASALIAPQILKNCGYNKAEIEEIVEAILCHNKVDKKNSTALGRLLYTADKASRNCFVCDAAKECKWSDEKKNISIIY